MGQSESRDSQAQVEKFLVCADAGRGPSIQMVWAAADEIRRLRGWMVWDPEGQHATPEAAYEEWLAEHGGRWDGEPLTDRYARQGVYLPPDEEESL